MLSSSDERERARLRLPQFLFEYVDGGAFDEVTLVSNIEELRKVRLRQRVLKDVSQIDTGCRLFGMPCDLPLVLGPVGLAGLFARRGEAGAAQAAKAGSIPFCLSTVSVCAIEEVSQAIGSPFWFQLYMVRDRSFMNDLLAIASEHCSALVLTVDMPVGATRYRDFRSGLSGASGFSGRARRAWQAVRRPGWSLDVGLCGRPHSLGNLAPLFGKQAGMDDFVAWISRNFDPAVTWRDIDFIRQRWSGPLIIKGIADPVDASLAIERGADAIVISNHGGRQLDGTISSIEALRAVRTEFGNGPQIHVDGGVRSGIDVFRMLASGADCVWVGRAWAYALAAGGTEGVRAMIGRFAIELRAAMAMTGCQSISDIGQESLI